MMNKREDADLELLETQTDTYWRSLSELESGEAEFSADKDYEYTPSADELHKFNLNRRKFMGLMGASVAMAGAAGCIRKPVERILPYNTRPEDIVPGKPLHFASAISLGRAVQGIIVESQEGRPTKIEGNPAHPMSLGATTTLAQAAVLDLYDPDRSQKPAHAGREVTWSKFFAALNDALTEPRANQGEGLAVLIEETPSPTFHALLAELKKKYPDSRVFCHDLSSPVNALEGWKLAGLQGAHPTYHVDKAKRILSVGSDFLGHEGDAVIHGRHFARGRDLQAIEDSGKLKDSTIPSQMNRLYVVEASFTNTGLTSDHRLRVRASEQGEFLAALAGKLVQAGFKAPEGGEELAKQLSERYNQFQKNNPSLNQDWDRWLNALANDFKAHAGESLVMVGEHLSARDHAVGLFVNALLGSFGSGKPVQLREDAGITTPDGIDGLVAAIRAGSVNTLVILGGNPVLTAPADLKFGVLLDALSHSFHLSQHFDETSKVATWHAPMNHFLESWGDLRSSDGTVSIQQPLIAPLYGTLSALELLAHIVGDQSVKGYDLVRNHWKSDIGGATFDSKWRRWLHEGIITGMTAPHDAAAAKKINWAPVKAVWLDTPTTQNSKGFELVFALDSKVHDGRFANNAWLQEAPDSISKLTWDNAAWINVQTARTHKLDNGEWIALSLGEKKLEIPVYIVPGLAENTIVLPLGYGREFNGRVSKGAGFNVYPLRTSETQHYASGATFIKMSRARYLLASTQEHGRADASFAGFGSLTEPDIMGRKGYNRASILRQASLDAYQEDPKRFQKMEFIRDKKKLKSLWKEPNYYRGPDKVQGQQWGMVIDLTKCSGCNTCLLACQAENNISVVGKERVANGREMHWVRIDRYFRNDPEYSEPTKIDDVEISSQPMACSQCQNAPCESVCPVAATTHSPDGLNDMAYNRCIGTRYCSNNCPYKVRRFNFFNYSKENSAQIPMMEMQRNPDVTVRFRGVMEKCTYCVQRINSAKIQAKAHGDGIVPDTGADSITTACEQACPSEAIVFGDVNNPDSRVSKLKNRDRDYVVLGELNNHPRTSYLARIRNRNPELKIKRAPKKTKKAAPAKRAPAKGKAPKQAAPKKRKG